MLGGDTAGSPLRRKRIQETRKNRGPGLWKFNDSLLVNEEYDELQKVISNTVQQYAIPLYSTDFASDPNNFQCIEFTISISLFYETLLMLIRGETVRFSKQKARKTREQEDKQIDTINKLQDAFNNNPTQRCLQQLEEAKSWLENIRKPQIKGLITRSRVQWHEDGERCSKYFLSLEKRNYIRKSIQCIKVDNKTVTSKPKILDLFSQSLSRKYTEESALTNSNIYFQDNIKKKFSQAQKRALDEPLSFEELRVALTRAPLGGGAETAPPPARFLA